MKPLEPIRWSLAHIEWELRELANDIGDLEARANGLHQKVAALLIEVQRATRGQPEQEGRSDSPVTGSGTEVSG